MKCIDEEIPFEIPQGWEWTRIGNIFNHTSGKQQSSSNKGGGTPQKFITTSNLYWGHFILDNVKIMNFTDEEIKTCSATKGDLLVCEGGAGYGRSAIWNEDYDICLQNHVHRLRPCVSGICEYTYHFIYLLKESNNLASVGTAMPGLSANRLKGLLLPFPPLSEQKRIVIKLGELLPQIDKYSKVQNQLDELNNVIKESLKKSILQEAIQGKLVPQIAEEGTAQKLLEQIKAEKQKLVKEGKLKKSALATSIIFRGDDNKYYEKVGKKTVCIEDEVPFKIPEKWGWCRLRQICNMQAGKNISANKIFSEQSPSHHYKCIGGNGLRGFTDIYNVEGHYAIIGRQGALCGCVNIADGRFYATEHAVIVDTFNLISPNFMFYYLTALNLNKYATATAQPGLSVSKVMEILSPLPPLKEQQRIVAQIEKLFEQLH